MSLLLTPGSISPWLSVGDTAKAVNYYKAAYNAVELDRLEDEAGNVEVAHLSIEEADVWVQHDPARMTSAEGRFG